MSNKLWIPGQTEKPISTDELVLPAGTEAPPPLPTPEAAPPESATGDTATTEAMAAQAEQLQEFLQKLHYPPASISITCPHCSASQPSIIFPIQDYGANPELLGMFLSGQLDRFVCAGCQQALMLQLPVLVHLPQQEFLAVVVPETADANAAPQDVIGNLSTSFLSKVPLKERKGYMLAPRQFMSMERLRDTLWEFQGVTREMRKRQQEQMVLLQQLLQAQSDPDVLESVVSSSGQLIDRTFILHLMQSAQEVPQESEEGKGIRAVLTYLLDHTPTGQQIRAQQEVLTDLLRRMQAGMDMAEQARVLTEYWSQDSGHDIVLTLVRTLPQRFGYEFLLELSTLIELEEQETARAAMEEMRSQIDALMKAMAQQQAQLQQNIYQASVSLISTALEAEDPAALLRKQMTLLRGPFLPVLMNMMAQAEKNKATDVVARLLYLRDVALQVQEETMNEEDRLLFRLITSRTVGAARTLMEQHKQQISRSLLDKMNKMESELRANDMADQAQKIKSLRGQMALMR